MAQTNSEGRITLPRQSFGSALSQNLLYQLASKQANPNTSFRRAEQFNALADELEESDDPRSIEMAERLRAEAGALPQVSQNSGIDPTSILSTVFSTFRQVDKQNQKISEYEKYVNNLQTSLLQQRAKLDSRNLQGVISPGAPLFSQGSVFKSNTLGVNRGISIPSYDATGEPGFDYSVEGGKENAIYFSPEEAEVVEVVGNQNWRTDLNTNPNGRRGYGNYVDLRFKRPDGKYFDARIAHFNAVNQNLKPGDRIPRGYPIGTQGTTGSTTGPHISFDLYGPGSYTGDLNTRDLIYPNMTSGRLFR